MANDFDIVVIGAGAGGATFAHACAVAGKNVLLIERGQNAQPDDSPFDEHATLVEKKPYDDRGLVINGVERRTYTASALGGGTTLYGAALMRPGEDDFIPGRYYGDRISRSIWEWPISYSALEPYYGAAETLFGVAGDASDDFGPLHKPSHGFPQLAIDLKPINRILMHANRARGLRPFRLPLAIDFQRCLQCASCPGFRCPTGARRSAADLVSQSQAPSKRVTIVMNTEVESLSQSYAGQVDGVRVRDRATGERMKYRAKRYALAAGAVASPALLLRSGFTNPWIGRNYMYHLSPIVAGVFPRPTGAENTFIKQLGFADFYHGSHRYPHKTGIIQSLPVPGPLMLAKCGAGRLPRVMMQALRERLIPLAGIVEDLPNPANRVALGSNGDPFLSHRFGSYDRERGRWLGTQMIRILKRAGALFSLSKPFPSAEHVAHQCGTLRFGKSAENAVADSECRMFGQPNLFIVDASFFPTSLGVGPALTIMANALRVAAIVVREV